MSDLADAARRAQLAFTNMGQAGDSLAQAMADAFQAAEALRVERDRLLVLLAVAGRPSVSAVRCKRVHVRPDTQGQRLELAPFERWLVETGRTPATARGYAARLSGLMVRSRVGLLDLARLPAETLRATDSHERTALKRWREYLRVQGGGAPEPRFAVVTGRVPPTARRDVRRHLSPFQEWLVGRGFSKSSARTYRNRLCITMNRLGVGVLDLVHLDEAQTREVSYHERTALRRWREFVSEQAVAG